MKKVFLYSTILTAILFLNITSTYAKPVISASSGVSKEGETLTISGSGFGVVDLNKIEWLGGADGAIEKGTPGNNFSSNGWLTDSESSAFYPPKYSSANVHSGSKSIISQWPLADQYGSGFIYDTGINGVGYVYATWWVYFDHVDSQGQWKFFRIMPNSTYGDGPSELFAGQWYTTSGGNYQNFNLVMCAAADAGADPSCYPSGDYGDRYPSNALPSGQWVRVEVFAKESSSAGVKDGTYEMYLHTQNKPPVLMNKNSVDWTNNIKTRVAGISQRWRYVTFQNYWGNISSGTGIKEKAYMDDIFIQVGSQARVEIGDNITWANCKQREIQYPVSWNTNSISIKANKGSFETCGKYYLFVVDGNGEVSDQDPSLAGAQGYAIKILNDQGEGPCKPGNPALQ